MAVLGRYDWDIRSITNNSFLSLADGKPLYWVGRAKGASELGHVPGPDFFKEALARFPQHGHFFYGSRPEVLSRLLVAAKQLSIGLKVCGSISPPFRPLTEDERLEHYRMIRESGAAFVWVGLGAPRQERWMAQAWEHLRPSVLLGVGAAFDFQAGSVRRAPHQFSKMGLEWMYRLVQEPRRLWKRYLVTNSLFAWYLLVELLHHRKPSQRAP
jgi:N-acetylglucosaminyldiphosphoundecaprenol N-acetyl-beta-D-mannosaminyltransferase